VGELGGGGFNGGGNARGGEAAMYRKFTRDGHQEPWQDFLTRQAQLDQNELNIMIISNAYVKRNTRVELWEYEIV
jgi:hypothetical protein